MKIYFQFFTYHIICITVDLYHLQLCKLLLGQGRFQEARNILLIGCSDRTSASLYLLLGESYLRTHTYRTHSMYILSYDARMRVWTFSFSIYCRNKSVDCLCHVFVSFYKVLNIAITLILLNTFEGIACYRLDRLDDAEDAFHEVCNVQYRTHSL